MRNLPEMCSGLSTVANIVAFEQYLLGFDDQVSELARRRMSGFDQERVQGLYASEHDFGGVDQKTPSAEERRNFKLTNQNKCNTHAS